MKHEYFIAGHERLPADKIAAANIIAEKNIRLAHKAASHFKWAKGYGLSDDDLLSCGYEALIVGTRIHDPRRGKLSTVVMFRMRQMVGRYVNAAKAAKRGSAGKVKTFNQRDELGKTLNDMQDSIGLPSDGKALLREDCQIIKSALSKLDQREQLVIWKRIAEDMTLDEIGKVIGVTKERVRQIEIESLEKLRYFYRKLS